MTITESNITINVQDLTKSISFYESIGLTLKNRWGDYYAQLSAPGGMVIGLHPSTAKSTTGNSGNVSIGFKTNDFEEVRSTLQKLSIDVTEREEEGGQFLHFSDPDGTFLYFIKSVW